MQDMLKKGRQNYPSGAEHYPTRLKLSDALAIRKLRLDGMPVKEIARIYDRKSNTDLEYHPREAVAIKTGPKARSVFVYQ